jgi:hypothetical protein
MRVHPLHENKTKERQLGTYIVITPPHTIERQRKKRKDRATSLPFSITTTKMHIPIALAKLATVREVWFSNVGFHNFIFAELMNEVCGNHTRLSMVTLAFFQI